MKPRSKAKTKKGVRTPAKGMVVSFGKRQFPYPKLVAIACAVAIVLAGVYILTSRAATTPPAIGSNPAPANYGLVWSDEFNGTAVDANKWNLMDKLNYGAANHEDQCYYARNAGVSDGPKKIPVKRHTTACNAKNPDGTDNTYFWTSAFLTTRSNQSQPTKYKFKYGYAEARIKMPKGNVYWPAFWLVGDGMTWPDYGEFDITEVVGVRPDLTMGSVHWACEGRPSCSTSAANVYNIATKSAYPWSSNYGTKLDPSNFNSYEGPTSSRFVRYGLLWEPDKLTFYVDGVPVRSFDGQTIMRINADGTQVVDKTVAEIYPNNPPKYDFKTVLANEHAIHLNMAMGGGMPQWWGYTGNENGAGGYNDGNLAANMPGNMEVDYVRVYQLNQGTTPPPPTADTTAPSAPSGLSAQAVSATQIDLKWTASTDNVGVAHYRITRDGGYDIGKVTTGTTFSDTTVSGAGWHSYVIYAVDTAGNQSVASNETAVVLPGGLKATYFDNKDLTGATVQRTDNGINFDWGIGSPVAGIGPDTFSVRWNGQIQVPKTGTYTFYTQSDDGVRLWVNGVQLVDAWSDHSSREDRGKIRLNAGKRYDIKMEYYDNSGSAVSRLFWSGPGVDKQIVPSNVLF